MFVNSSSLSLTRTYMLYHSLLTLLNEKLRYIKNAVREKKGTEKAA